MVLKLASKSDIVGAGPEINAQITRDILYGKKKVQKLDIVLINSAVALLVDGKTRDIKEGVEIAKRCYKWRKKQKKTRRNYQIFLKSILIMKREFCLI